MRNGFSVTAERVFGLSWGQFCDLTLVDLFGLFYSEALRKRRLIEEGRGRGERTDCSTERFCEDFSLLNLCTINLGTDHRAEGNL